MLREIMARAAVDRQIQRGEIGALGHTDRFGLDVRRLAGFVGVVALGLPTALILYSKFSDTCTRDSISHYFYSPFFGSVFVASLTLIAAFLIAYRGDSFWWETPAARVAGSMALGVALFPTDGHGCTDAGGFVARPIVTFAAQSEGAVALPLPDMGQAYFQIAEWAATLHYICAIVLFVFLFVYAAVVFPSTAPGETRQKDGAALSWYKTIRNLIYYATAVAILAAIVTIGLHFAGITSDPDWEARNKLFFWEAVALYAFGAGWIVKGRFLGLLPEE